MAVIDGIMLKGNNVVIPETLQRHALEGLHVSHMRNEKKQTPGRQINLLDRYE